VYLTNRGHALAVANSEYLAFDFTAADRVMLEVWSGQVRGRIFDAPTPMSALEAITEYTGRMQPLPAWTQSGALLRVRGGSAAARKALAEAKAAGAHVAALWIEDWEGERSTPFGFRMLWNWAVDRDLYPDWETLVGEVNAEGVRVIIYFNPFLADPSGWSPRRNLYAEAVQQKLLVTKADGTVYPVGNGGFSAGMIDLTNPAARTFIKDAMKAQLAIGVSGWMADFGEALPYDAKLSSGADPRSFHNQYPFEWARLNREAIAEAGREGDALFFSRSGNALSPQQSMAFWIGDQNVTWDANDGIKTVIPALLSGGLSGYALDHIDTGGWLSVTIPLIGFTRSKELEQRWLELGAFGALYRLHHSNKPYDNWQYNSDSETLALFARMTRLYAALAPLRQRSMADAAEHGYPLIRHTLLGTPDDPTAYGLNEQFMIGDDIVVAPVVDQGKTTVDAWLPPGEWLLAWSGASFGYADAGQRVTLPAPIGQPPILYRRGSADGATLMTRLHAEGLL
jgi:alpha-glucosidase